jgi:DNA-binding transcriptional regulator YiaG
MLLVDATDFARLRKRLELTQEGLAAQLGVHPMTVSRWERGERSIPGPVAVLMEHFAKQARSTKRKR